MDEGRRNIITDILVKEIHNSKLNQVNINDFARKYGYDYNEIKNIQDQLISEQACHLVGNGWLRILNYKIIDDGGWISYKDKITEINDTENQIRWYQLRRQKYWWVYALIGAFLQSVAQIIFRYLNQN